MEQINKRFMNWASILEDNTREQAETTATMPFIYPHLALMPDAHLGQGRDRRVGHPDARARSSRPRSASTSAAA